jgi:LacI family transcriptional regulator
MSQRNRTIGGAARMTLHDVARAAGVSKSTASRLLDERLPCSESERARQVRKIAEEMGYVRHVSAASLRRGKTGMIGVIVPRLTDTVMAMLYEALSRAAARSGQFTIVATTEDDPDAVRHAAETLLRRGVDGLVLATARHDDPVTKDLAARGVPFVLALRTDGVSLSSVGDDRLGGYLATRHLLDLGHLRIGLIAGPAFASSATGRREGYVQALAEAGMAADPALIVASSFSIEAGVAAARRLVALSPRPTAIFAVNDNIAIGAMSCLAQLGLSVPGDISLVGYNDIPLVGLLPTPLTSVRVPFDQIALEALNLLAENRETLSIPIRRAAPTLIPRKTTTRLGREVAAAG